MTQKPQGESEEISSLAEGEGFGYSEKPWNKEILVSTHQDCCAVLAMVAIRREKRQHEEALELLRSTLSGQYQLIQQLASSESTEQELSEKNIVRTGAVRCNLAGIISAQKLRQFEQAHAFFGLAERWAEASGDTETLTKVINNRAATYKYEGKTDVALQTLERYDTLLMELVTKRKLTAAEAVWMRASNLSNLGEISKEAAFQTTPAGKEYADKALKYHREALNLRRKLTTSDAQEQVVESLSNLGDLLILMGNTDEALALLFEAVETNTKETNRIELLARYSRALMADGQIKEAQKTFKRLEEVYKQMEETNRLEDEDPEEFEKARKSITADDHNL